jgi:hypothetical protein
VSSLDHYPRRDGLYRIMPHAIAVHNRYEDRVILLDALSSEVWLRADGRTSLRDIARDIASGRGIPPHALYTSLSILAVLLNCEGILFSLKHPESLPYHLQYAQEDQDRHRMHASLVAAGWLEE